MKLVIAVVQESDDDILDALTEAGIAVTRSPVGGFLREPNITLFIGVQEDLLKLLSTSWIQIAGRDGCL